MTESRRCRFSSSFKHRVVAAAMREGSSTAELAQRYGVHASQVLSWKRQSWQVVRAYFDGKFSRPRRSPPDPVLLARID